MWPGFIGNWLCKPEVLGRPGLEEMRGSLPHQKTQKSMQEAAKGQLHPLILPSVYRLVPQSPASSDECTCLYGSQTSLGNLHGYSLPLLPLPAKGPQYRIRVSVFCFMYWLDDASGFLPPYKWGKIPHHIQDELLPNQRLLFIPN